MRAYRQGAVQTAARLLTLIVMLAGCAGASTDALVGRAFLSTAINEDGAPRPLVPGTQIRLTFGVDGAIGVNAGCNTMGGSYRVEGSSLRVDGGAMTEMACDGPRMAQDDRVFAFIGSGPTISLDGDELVLSSGGLVARFVDRGGAEPDLPLVGPTWRVDSIVAGDAVSSVPGGVVATLQFGADGRVQVATGCNRGGGSYRVDGDTIAFGTLALTEMACEGPSGAMEAAVLAVVGSGAVAYTIDASALTLDAGGPGLILRVP